MSESLNNKILFLTSVFRRGYGVGLVIRMQLDELISQGYKNLYIATPDRQEITKNEFGSEITVLKIGSSYNDVKKVILEIQPAIAIVHTPPFYEHIAKFNQNALIKIAYDHGEPFPDLFPEDSEERKRINSVKYDAISTFNYHISISEFIKRSSRVENSTVIYNGVDHIELEGNGNEVNIREHLNLSPNDFIISSLSRIGVGEGNYKGYDLLMQIKEKVLEKLSGKKISFVIMGRSIPKGNKAERKFKKEGFILLENVDEPLKRNVLNQSDIFISPSIWEGFNLPLTEAQYLGTPSICFSAGSHPEVCPYHFASINEVVAYIETLYHNPKLRSYVGESCKNFVRKKFRWKDNIKKFVDVINKAISENGKVILSEALSQKALADTHFIEAHLKRISKEGVVRPGKIPGTYKVEYLVPTPPPKISIIIPNKNHFEDLDQCIKSILNISTYKNYEVIVAENDTTEKKTLKLYRELEKTPLVKIITWKKAFNFAAINNFAVKHATGEYLLFLNNDTQVISPDWLERMLEHAIQEEVGAVGAKLYYPDGAIQHGGIIIGIRGVAAHAYNRIDKNDNGYFGGLNVVQNMSAVTAACMMVRKKVFEEVQGFDENYILAFNDVDLCLKIREKDYLIVWTPYAELYHHELKSRGNEDSPEKQERFKHEFDLFQTKWKGFLKKGDPYYNPNFSLETEDFSINI